MCDEKLLDRIDELEDCLMECNPYVPPELWDKITQVLHNE